MDRDRAEHALDWYAGLRVVRQGVVGHLLQDLERGPVRTSVLVERHVPYPSRPMPEDAVTMDKIVSLSKRRGFVFPSSEIYGWFDELLQPSAGTEEAPG